MSHNTIHSKRFVFFFGGGDDGFNDGYYQIIHTTISVNDAEEPFCPCSGSIKCVSMSILNNTGNGNLVANLRMRSLHFIDSLFGLNTHTGFGVDALFESCSFCLNKFTTDIPCNPDKSTELKRVRRCANRPPTVGFTVHDDGDPVIFVAWTFLRLVGIVNG